MRKWNTSATTTNSALGGAEWVPSRHSRFTPEEWIVRNNLVRRRVDIKSLSGRLVEEINLFNLPEIERRLLSDPEQYEKAYYYVS